jgi:hypothetical protein
MIAFRRFPASNEAYQAIVDAHFDSINATEKLFKMFLLEILKRRPDELDSLAN